jgi:hypothetical protein
VIPVSLPGELLKIGPEGSRMELALFFLLFLSYPLALGWISVQMD